MQGFNMGRYRPYDSDPSKQPFNSTKHPLGDRARKLDQGILIVRFELPFNIWCSSCQNHIGQGVRYNAEKKQVGNYHSTKIWSFRCKCHLCSSWFEIRTDPKNTRYVVHEGARQQNRDWDPEENGGYAIYDPEAAASKPKDAFSELEKKTEEKRRAKTSTERILEIERLNHERWDDPYSLNVRLRNTFRKGKREDQEKERKDDELRERIGWRGDQKLVEIDEKEARSLWLAEKDRSQREMAEKGKFSPSLSTPSSSSSGSKRRVTLEAPVEDERKKSTRLTSRSSPLQPSLPRSESSSVPRDRKLKPPSGGNTKAPGSKSTGRTTSTTTAAEKLKSRLISNTRQKNDPFLQQIKR
ncbi:DUF572-domain-containing protein [Violaceomyces palustris]|uniref:DUF572-domain-containing protein n=1 Tax=Violaceomyces palustris TaxID=1673888 RepID=A0ACD0NWP2_9BASI|nr:DUF572-domain-containing protein [Violaceomyces palustris]